jgi:hypothetical protein
MKEQKSNSWGLWALVLLLTLVSGVSSYAGTDATAIIDGATTAFASVAALCVSIGTFFVVYSLVKRVH